MIYRNLLSRNRLKALFTLMVYGGALMGSLAASAGTAVETAFGPVTISAHPERVVTLSDNSLDAALALGVKPVGALASRGGSDIPDYLKAASGNLPLVGSVRAINLEAILATRPDLILAGPDVTRDQYAKLSLIAPTVVPKGNVMSDWRFSLRLYAQALGKTGEAEERLAQVEQRIDTLRTRLPKGLSISVLRWNPQGPVMMSSHLFAGQLLEELGTSANALAAEQVARPHTDTLSLENLGKADGDWIFLATLNNDGQRALAEARQQPAFTRLKASQANHLASVDGQIWSSSSGYLAAQQVLDDVEKALAK